MVQHEIIVFLKEQDSPVTSNTIADNIGISLAQVQRALRQLVKFKMIHQDKIDHRQYCYSHKQEETP